MCVTLTHTHMMCISSLTGELYDYSEDGCKIEPEQLTLAIFTKGQDWGHLDREIFLQIAEEFRYESVQN